MSKKRFRKRFSVIWGNSSEIKTTAYIENGQIILISEIRDNGYYTFMTKTNKDFDNEIKWFIHIAYAKLGMDAYNSFVESLNTDFLEKHFTKLYLPKY